MTDTLRHTGIVKDAQGRLALRKIDDLNEALGTKSPAGLRKDLTQLRENHDKILTEIKEQPPLIEALTRALESGESILTGPGVQAIIAADAYNGINLGQALENIREQQSRKTITNHLPALFKTWAKPVAEAAEAIAKAKKELPTASLRDPAAAAGLSPTEFKTWAPGHAAVKTLDAVLSAAPHLYGLTPTGVPAPNRHGLILAPLTIQQLEHLAKQNQSPDARNRKVNHLEDLKDIEISLADPDELNARLQAVRNQVRAREEARARQAQAAFRHEASHGGIRMGM